MSLYSSLNRLENKITTIVGPTGSGKTMMVLSIMDQLFSKDLSINRLIGDGSFFLITNDRLIIRGENKIDYSKVLFVQDFLDPEVILRESEKVLRQFFHLDYLIIDAELNFDFNQETHFFNKMRDIILSKKTNLIITRGTRRSNPSSVSTGVGGYIGQISDLIISMNGSYGEIVKWRNSGIGDIISKDVCGKRYKLY